MSATYSSELAGFFFFLVSLLELFLDLLLDFLLLDFLLLLELFFLELLREDLLLLFFEERDGGRRSASARTKSL